MKDKYYETQSFKPDREVIEEREEYIWTSDCQNGYTNTVTELVFYKGKKGKCRAMKVKQEKRLILNEGDEHLVSYSDDTINV